MRRLLKAMTWQKKLCGIAVLGVAIGLSSFTVNAETAYDYNVTDAEFGADGSDNVADNEALQKSLDKAIGSTKMVTIYVPSGKYYVESSLRIYSNTHIILDDNAVIERRGKALNNNLIRNCDQNGGIEVIGGYDMSHDIIMEGGTWDGGDLASITSSSDVIRFDHAKNITIKNCTMKNAYDCHILEFIGIKNGLVTGCTFRGFRYCKGKEKNYEYAREAFQLEAAWTENEANPSAEKGRWAKGTVIDGTACDNVTVSNNSFIDMPCGVGQHRISSTGKARCKNIVISGNTITCSSSMKYCKTAVSCSGIDGLTVKDNKINGPYRFAVHEIRSTDVLIENNTITGAKVNSIMIDKGDVTAISGNIIKKAGKHAISISDGKVGKVDNNNIVSPVRNGINLTGGNVSSICGNTIQSAGGNGIVSAKGTGASVKAISKNKITKPKGSGIVIEYGKVTLIKGNTIKNASKHGISAIGGTIGTGSKKNNGILNNTINTCKLNGITVSVKGKISAISGNKVTGAKNNGISLTQKCKVYWIIKNTVKKCKNHDIWIGISGVKASGNKAKVDKL